MHSIESNNELSRKESVALIGWPERTFRLRYAHKEETVESEGYYRYRYKYTFQRQLRMSTEEYRAEMGNHIKKEMAMEGLHRSWAPSRHYYRYNWGNIGGKKVEGVELRTDKLRQLVTDEVMNGILKDASEQVNKYFELGSRDSIWNDPGLFPMVWEEPPKPVQDYLSGIGVPTVHVTEMTGLKCQRQIWHVHNKSQGTDTVHAVTARGIMFHGIIKKVIQGAMQNGYILFDRYEPPEYTDIIPEYRRKEIPEAMWDKLIMSVMELVNRGVNFLRDKFWLLDKDNGVHLEEEMRNVFMEIPLRLVEDDDKKYPVLVDNTAGVFGMLSGTPDLWIERVKDIKAAAAMGIQDDTGIIIDFKTGSKPQGSHEVQILSYTSMLRERGHRLGKAWIVYLGGEVEQDEEGEKKKTRYNARRKAKEDLGWEFKKDYTLKPMDISGYGVREWEWTFAKRMRDSYRFFSDPKVMPKEAMPCEYGFHCTYCDYRGICNGV